MSKILLKNARILSMENREIIHGDVVVDGSSIFYVGPDSTPYAPFDKIIDIKNNLLMPSFKNGHAHSAMVFARSYADKMKLEDWLYKSIFPMEAHFKKDDIYHLSKVAFLEYIRNGITYAHEMYFEPAENLKAAYELGIRDNLLIMDIDENKERLVSELKSEYPDAAFTYGIHAIYTTNEETLDRVNEYIHKYKLPFYLHLGETKKEVGDFFEKHRKTIIFYLVEKGLFDFGGAIFHGIYLTDEDIELCKKYNITIISNPSSNLKLASGIAPLAKYLDASLNVGLGTDGASSNNSLDMFKEMFLASTLSKVLFDDPTLVDPFDVLKMATVNVMKGLHEEDRMYLKAGQKADIIEIDMTHSSMQPENDIIANLVYSGSSSLIKMTMSDGKILFLNGKYQLDQSINKIYKKATSISRRLQKYSKKN